MSIQRELELKGAPRKVLEAGEVIDKHVAANIRPPKDVVAFVQAWVGQSNTQDRYGL